MCFFCFEIRPVLSLNKESKEKHLLLTCFVARNLPVARVLLFVVRVTETKSLALMASLDSVTICTPESVFGDSLFLISPTVIFLSPTLFLRSLESDNTLSILPGLKRSSWSRDGIGSFNFFSISYKFGVWTVSLS